MTYIQAIYFDTRVPNLKSLWLIAQKIWSLTTHIDIVKAKPIDLYATILRSTVTYIYVYMYTCIYVSLQYYWKRDEKERLHTSVLWIPTVNILHSLRISFIWQNTRPSLNSSGHIVTAYNSLYIWLALHVQNFLLFYNDQHWLIHTQLATTKSRGCQLPLW